MAKKGTIEIDSETCKGCCLCIRACPMKVIEADTSPNSSGSHPAIAANTDKCIACGACHAVCPDACVTVFEEAAA
jgi:2-oxoglutarate ferredoxin oxidoreductase subunit delta